MYRIDKTFEFCYGHRVWTQVLDGNYADDLKCACRHLHGHEAKVQVYLEAEELKDSMVTDFRHLEWLKKWINNFVDHKFIIDSSDPLYETLVGNDVPMSKAGIDLIDNFKIVGSIPELGPYMPVYTLKSSGRQINAAQYEMLSGMLIVDFVPTSENLAKWLHGIVSAKMSRLNVRVPQVDWWETPKSKSSYIED